MGNLLTSFWINMTITLIFANLRILGTYKEDFTRAKITKIVPKQKNFLKDFVFSIGIHSMQG